MTSTAITRPTDEDLHLWNEGLHHRAYEMLGAHLHSECSYEIVNSDAQQYGGIGQGNLGSVDTGPPGVPSHGRLQTLDLILPPQGVVAFRHRR